MNLQTVNAFATAAALALAGATRADSCDTSALSPALTSDDATQCSSDSGYDFSSLSAPTDDVMALMCSSAACQSALEAVEALGLGDCTVGAVSIESGLIEPIVAYCSSSSSAVASASSETSDYSDEETFDTDASDIESLETDSADVDINETDSAETGSSATGSSSGGLDEDFDDDADSTLDDDSFSSGSVDFQVLVADEADDFNSTSSASAGSDVDVGDSSSGSDYSVEGSESTASSASKATESSASTSSASASTSSSSSGSNAGASLASTSAVVGSAVAATLVAHFM